MFEHLGPLVQLQAYYKKTNTMLSVGPEHTRAVNRNRANLWEVPARYGALLSKYHTL
jgi:hypothetical protein